MSFFNIKNTTKIFCQWRLQHVQLRLTKRFISFSFSSFKNECCNPHHFLICVLDRETQLHKSGTRDIFWYLSYATIHAPHLQLLLLIYQHPFTWEGFISISSWRETKTKTSDHVTGISYIKQPFDTQYAFLYLVARYTYRFLIPVEDMGSWPFSISSGFLSQSFISSGFSLSLAVSSFLASIWANLQDNYIWVI